MPDSAMPLGELQIIDELRAALPAPAPWVEQAIGDDCAVLRQGASSLLLTKDLLVEGVHFRRCDLSAQQLGYKALAVNVSDVAAMGGEPAAALLGLGVPPGVPAEWVRGLRGGLLECAAEFGVDIVGGDTVAAPGGVVLSVTLVGRAAPGEAVLRSGGRAGDVLAVGGALGGSAAGLSLLLAGLQGGEGRGDADELAACAAHVRPRPQVALGRLLATRGLATAMLDVSDGLLLDLSRLCAASGVGARVDPALVPLPSWAQRLARRRGADALQWALQGGEDYVLLFSVSPQHWETLVQACAELPGPAPVAIGALQAEAGLWLGPAGEAHAVEPRGYEHLGSRGLG